VGTAKLTPVPGGSATLSRDAASGIITVTFDLFGLALRSAHAVALRSGSCHSPGQRTIASFPDLTANTFGAMQGKVSATDSSAGVPAGSHLAIELAPAAQARSAPGSAVIACADIGTANPSSPLTLTAFTGQSSSGTVTLTYFSSGRLNVHVVASGFTPDSKHAGHVHFGSCRQQSGVLYTLGDLTADTHGNIDATITLTGITAPPPVRGWYADLHLARASGLEAGGQPTLLFQPFLCGDGSR
jgi:hypothetical protein